MTAHAMDDDRDRCIQAGMNDYLTKPIDPVEMFSIIGQATVAILYMPNSLEFMNQFTTDNRI